MNALDTIQGNTTADKLTWIGGSLFLLRETIPMDKRRDPGYSEAWDAIVAAEEAIYDATEILRARRV